MACGEAFKVDGRVIEALPNGTYLAELSNGHRLTAFVPGKMKKRLGGFKVGDSVKLQLTPYDLNTGRIIFSEEE